MLFATYGAIGVLDNEEDGRVEALHLPVQRVQAEAVNGGAVDQRPAVALGAGGQVLRELDEVRKKVLEKNI